MSSPRAAEQYIERVDNTCVFFREGGDSHPKHAGRNIRDPQRIEHNIAEAHEEMWRNIAVRKLETLCIQQRRDNTLT